jgi:hypothetical protein
MYIGHKILILKMVSSLGIDFESWLKRRECESRKVNILFLYIFEEFMKYIFLNFLKISKKNTDYLNCLISCF